MSGLELGLGLRLGLGLGLVFCIVGCVVVDVESESVLVSVLVLVLVLSCACLSYGWLVLSCACLGLVCLTLHTCFTERQREIGQRQLCSGLVSAKQKAVPERPKHKNQQDKDKARQDKTQGWYLHRYECCSAARPMIYPQDSSTGPNNDNDRIIIVVPKQNQHSTR